MNSISSSLSRRWLSLILAVFSHHSMMPMSMTTLVATIAPMSDQFMAPPKVVDHVCMAWQGSTAAAASERAE